MTSTIHTYLAIWLFFSVGASTSGDKYSKTEEIRRHITYLASDELKGRGIGTPEIDRAAAYIARYFDQQGLQTIEGLAGYYQEFDLAERQAPLSIELVLGDQKISMNEGIIMANGEDLKLDDADIEFVDFGTEEDLSGKSLEGKIVVTKLGFPGQDQMESYYSQMDKKRNLIRKSGAIALVELYKSKQIPWNRMARFFGGGGLNIKTSESPFPHFFIRDTTVLETLSALKDAKASIVVETSEPKIIQAKNVIGYIDGTDPALKDEVILVGAHYDHVGIGRPVNNENNEPDSIYNGARDNAAGTVALMMAAKELSQNPPKRPVALIAITAEESGLVGSRYYASNPAIALKRTAFFLNNDNGGYNDTTITTVVGASRSNVKAAIKEGIAKKGLEFYDSEELDQGFFERSDNISLSVKGVPSATISMGFRQMDNEITQYYHQPADEVESIDMAYITKWIEGFVEATRNIADMEEKPFWKKDDSFEELGKKLYDLE